MLVFNIVETNYLPTKHVNAIGLKDHGDVKR
jgi:hypothetical protein